MSSAREVFAQTPVRRYLVAVGLAALGAQIVVTVMFWQAYELTGDELDIAWLGLAQFIPAIMLVLVSGWFADRFDRRRVAAIAMFGRAVCAAAAVAYTLSEPTQIWPLFVIAAALGAVESILMPARRAMAPSIVAPEDLPRLVALWTTIFTATAIVGPIIGGLLIRANPAWAYAAGAVLELVAIVPTLRLTYVREPTRLTDRPTLGAALQGLTFIRSTPIVFAAVTLDLLAVLFGGSVALIKPVSDALGLSDVGYGVLRAAPGVGAALMALFLVWRPLKRHVGTSLLITVGVFGLGTIVFGWTNSAVVAFAALAVASAADMVSMVIRSSIVPLATPEDQLGRVTAVEGVFIGASNELGAFESGLTARLFGLSPAIIFGGAMTLLVAGSFSFLFPSVRRLDRFSDVQAAAGIEPAPE